MSKFRLICLAFDGDMVTERGIFDSVKEAWDRSNEMGSRWFFYPFHFVVTESGATIKDGPSPLQFLNGKRTPTVRRIFKRISNMKNGTQVGIDTFIARIRRDYLPEGPVPR